MKAKTTKQVLELTQRELEKMTDKELKQAISTLRSTARKRYERIISSGVYSQAANALWRSSGKGGVLPTVKGMDRLTLYSEFKRYGGFLKSKTSTVTGARKVSSQTKNLVEDLSGKKDFTDAEITEIFEMADALKTSVLNTIQSSTDRISAVSEVYDPKLSRKEIIERAREKMMNEYERENPTTPLGIYPSRAIR